MSPEMVSLLLSVPFILVVLITGLIFCRKGYKQGLWRALISLGVTVVSTVLSLLLSRVIAGTLSGVILNLLPAIDLGDMRSFNDLATTFVQGIVQEVLAILLFGLFLFLFLIVLKIVGNHIKPEALKTESKGMKWGGLGVRILDTVLVSMLLLLPLYGTVATYVTPAAKMAEMAVGADSDTVKFLSRVANNPIVALYKAGPASWVQGGLSGFKVGNATVDLTDIADLMDEAIEKYERLINAEHGDDVIEATADLSEFLRKNLIEEEWFYTIVVEAKAEVEKILTEEEMDAEDRALVQQFLDVADMSQEEFENNGIAVLDFITYSLENGVVEFAQSGDYNDLPEDFYAKLGALLNHSKQATTVKKMILVGMTEQIYYDYDEVFDLLPDNYTDEQWDTAYNSLRKQAKEKAEAFVNAHWGDGKVTDPAQQAKEGEAFMIFFFESDELNMLEAFVRHPNYTYEDVKPLLTVDMILRESYRYSDSEMRVVLENNPDLLNPLHEKLKSYESAPLSDTYFKDYVELALNLAARNSGNFGDVGALSSDGIRFVLDYYGEDALIPAGSSVSAEAKDVIDACLSALEKNPSASVNFSEFISLMEAAKDTSRWPDRMPEFPSYNFDYTKNEDGSISASLGETTSGTEDADEEEMEIYSEFYWSLQISLSDDLLCTALSDLTASKGADPFGLGKNLSAEEKACFVEILDSVINSTGNIMIGGNGFISMGDGNMSFGDAIGDSAAMGDMYFGSAGSASGDVSYEGGGMQMVIVSGSVGGAGMSGDVDSEQAQAEYKAQLEKNAAALKAFFGIDG